MPKVFLCKMGDALAGPEELKEKSRLVSLPGIPKEGDNMVLEDRTHWHVVGVVWSLSPATVSVLIGEGAKI